MIAHDVDIALVDGPVSDDELFSNPWRTDVMGLVTGPEHRFAQSTHGIDAAALNDEILILREPGSGSREVVAQALNERNVHPKQTLEIGSTEAIKQAVAAGLGTSIVSRVTISDQVTLGTLSWIQIKDVRIERTLWQLKSPGRIDIPAATEFKRIIWKGLACR